MSSDILANKNCADNVGKSGAYQAFCFDAPDATNWCHASATDTKFVEAKSGWTSAFIGNCQMYTVSMNNYPCQTVIYTASSCTGTNSHLLSQV